METAKREGMKVHRNTVFDMEKLYARLLVISTKRHLPLEVVISYELCPMPTFLFDDYGLMKSTKKSTLVTKLDVLSGEDEPEIPEVEIID